MSQPTRILYLNHTGKVSGAEKVLLYMLKGLRRDFFVPMVICGSDGPLAETIKTMGIECDTVTPLQARFTARPDHLFKYCISIAMSIFELRSRIKRARPDILHCNTVRSGIVATAATAGMSMPIIWHVHDILPNHFISTVIRYLAYLSKRSQALCVSRATAAAFKRSLDFGNRVNVLHNGVDLSQFPRKVAADCAFRSTLGIDLNLPLFCTVGQIAPRKNLRGLLNAFSQFQHHSGPASLLIVGEAIFNEYFNYRDELLQQVKNLGQQRNVHFLGARQDVPAIMRACDALILNSLEEPFGLVLVEAMSSGTTVVATEVGGIPEIVTDRVTGFLVPSDAPDVLAATLRQIVDNQNLCLAIEDKAWNTVCPEYSVQIFLSKLDAFYTRVASDISRLDTVAEVRAYS